MINLKQHVKRHLDDVSNLKDTATNIRGEFGFDALPYIDKDIRPAFTCVQQAAEEIFGEIRQLPVDVRDEDGKLEFTDTGQIKLESLTLEIDK